VVVLPGVAAHDSSRFEGIMDHANAVLAEMAEEGAITADERARMVLGAHPRRKTDLMAPFAQDGQFQDLTVEGFAESVLTDSAWTDDESDGDRKALASRHALFFRSIFKPSLAVALTRVRNGDTEALAAFGDRLEKGLKRRLERQPAAMHSFVHTIVLAKQCSA
jgi:hypothetical protein